MVEDDKSGPPSKGRDRPTGGNAGTQDSADKTRRGQRVPRPWHGADEKDRDANETSSFSSNTGNNAKDDEALAAAFSPQQQTHVPRPWHQAGNAGDQRDETPSGQHAQDKNEAEHTVDESAPPEPPRRQAPDAERHRGEVPRGQYPQGDKYAAHAFEESTPREPTRKRAPRRRAPDTERHRGDASRGQHAQGGQYAAHAFEEPTPRGPTRHRAPPGKRGPRRPPASARPANYTPPPPPPWPAKRRRPKRAAQLVFLGAILVAGVILFAGPLLSFHAQGIIGARVSRLAPSNDLTVASVAVHSGQNVRKGDVLIKLTEPKLAQKLAHLKAEIADTASNHGGSAKPAASKQQVAALRARIGQLRSDLRDLGHQYADAQAHAQKLRDQTQNDSITPPEILRQANEAVRQTRAQYHDKAAQLRTDEQKLQKFEGSPNSASHSSQELASLKQARDRISARLRALQLRAPEDGVIANVSARKGQALTAGETAITEVPSNDHRALLYFPRSARSHLSDGQTLSVKASGGSTLQMKIDRIFSSPKEMPPDLRRLSGQQATSIVVLANPVNASQAAGLSPGTNVSARLSRW